MALFLISFLVIVLAGLGMALGLLFTDRPLRQSCAGIVGMQSHDGACPGCPRAGDPARRKEGEAT